MVQEHTIEKLRTRIQISRYLAHCSFLSISGGSQTSACITVTWRAFKTRIAEPQPQDVSSVGLGWGLRTHFLQAPDSLLLLVWDHTFRTTALCASLSLTLKSP